MYSDEPSERLSFLSEEIDRDGAGTGVTADGHADHVHLDLPVDVRETFLHQGFQRQRVFETVGMADIAAAAVRFAAVGKLRHLLDEGTERELSLPFAELGTVTVLGKNKLNLYHGGEIYQFKGSKRFNALKYVNLIHRYQNMTQGDKHGEFLGL